MNSIKKSRVYTLNLKISEKSSTLDDCEFHFWPLLGGFQSFLFLSSRLRFLLLANLVWIYIYALFQLGEPICSRSLQCDYSRPDVVAQSSPYGHIRPLGAAICILATQKSAYSHKCIFLGTTMIPLGSLSSLISHQFTRIQPPMPIPIHGCPLHLAAVIPCYPLSSLHSPTHSFPDSGRQLPLLSCSCRRTAISRSIILITPQPFPTCKKSAFHHLKSCTLFKDFRITHKQCYPACL